MITINRRGDVFLDFISCQTPLVPEADKEIPLTHALVVVQYQGNFLFIFNTWKQKWELPGGIIEAGESPQQCAVRELLEETNQQLPDLVFKGLMKFQLQPDNRLEYGALYAGELLSVTDFVENAEADKIVFWDLAANIGYVDEIDRKIIDFG